MNSISADETKEKSGVQRPCLLVKEFVPVCQCARAESCHRETPPSPSRGFHRWALVVFQCASPQESYVGSTLLIKSGETSKLHDSWAAPPRSRFDWFVNGWRPILTGNLKENEVFICGMRFQFWGPISTTADCQTTSYAFETANHERQIPVRKIMFHFLLSKLQLSFRIAFQWNNCQHDIDIYI